MKNSTRMQRMAGTLMVIRIRIIRSYSHIGITL